MISKLAILCGLSVIVVNSGPKNWIDMLNDINRKHLGINTITESQRRLTGTQNYQQSDLHGHLVDWDSQIQEWKRQRKQDRKKLDDLNEAIKAYWKLVAAYDHYERNSGVLESHAISEVVHLVENYIKRVDPKSHIKHHSERGPGSHGEFVTQFMGQAVPDGTSGDGRWFHIASQDGLFGRIIQIAKDNFVDGDSLNNKAKELEQDIESINDQIAEWKRSINRHVFGTPEQDKENIGANIATQPLGSPKEMIEYNKVAPQDEVNTRRSKRRSKRPVSQAAQSSQYPSASSSSMNARVDQSNHRSQSQAFVIREDSSDQQQRESQPISGTQGLQRPPLLSRTNSIRQTLNGRSASPKPVLSREGSIKSQRSGLPQVPLLPTFGGTFGRQASQVSSKPPLLPRTGSIRTQSPGLDRVNSGQGTPYSRSPRMSRANSRQTAPNMHNQSSRLVRTVSGQSTPAHTPRNSMGAYQALGRSPSDEYFNGAPL